MNETGSCWKEDFLIKHHSLMRGQNFVAIRIAKINRRAEADKY